MFEISGLVDAKVRDLGEVIGESRGIPPRGRGEFKESDVLAVGLRFERDDRPTRHGNLLGWPIEGPELRARHRAIAVELSARAALVIH